MAIISAQATATSCTIKIEGDMTIHFASDLKAGMLALLSPSISLGLDLSEVEEIDTSGLQLIALFMREARAAGCPCSILSPGPSVQALFALYNFTGDANG